MKTDCGEDSGLVKSSRGSDTQVRLSGYGYATRLNTCGRHGAHCFKAAAHNIALSLLRPRWINAFKLTCHNGRPVTSTLAAGLRAC